MLNKKNRKPDPVMIQRAAKVKRRLVNACQKEPDVLLVQYDTSYKGFDEEQVDDMREEHGRNAITQVKKVPIWRRLVNAFVNPFTVVLFILAAISFFTNETAAVLIVLTMVTLSGLLQFSQELRSGKAAARLSEMVETTVAVQRQFEDDEGESKSRRVEIPLDEVVVGDLIYLAAGDIIPADVRIIRAKDLFISQASLTGESEPVEKFIDPVHYKPVNPQEINNLTFMGSTVISGSATALVLAVGDDTMVGQLARQLQTKKEPTSFDKGINAVSWVLIRFMLVMVPFVFLFNGLSPAKSWMDAFLFALSVAVGLTPEMLPMIVSANLAKGAVSMARKKVIVKDLTSIQNFGAMDVLCTDKTGTITQDKVILEYHLNVHGDEDMRVLRHAFLNSYYQTGLKNLMDISIIEHATEKNLLGIRRDFRKVDEIPFDFNRRRMSVVVEDGNGKAQMITKGAIEEMLAVSSHAEYQGEILPITPELRKEILGTSSQYNADGMRVLGIAQKSSDKTAGSFSTADESDMVLIGYLAFLDPPKESAEEAIATLGAYGVTVKVLTGDNDAVTRCVCGQVKLDAGHIILGSDVELMTDEQLKVAVEETNVFAKLTPQQKARIVTTLRNNGHVVGYMGDGINDAAAMKVADVGISVDTAVDIAKESANIILLEKDLMVLKEGIVSGRSIYANIIKYIKMTVSSNFGNMLSVLAASVILPFLPMLPLQILILNLIYDISCLTIPWDNVDAEYLQKPRKWDASSVTRFMLWIGPTSSIFDITTYLAMFFVVCPLVFGASYAGLIGTEAAAQFIMLFHAGWFVESLWSQTLVVHMIRTPKVPFIQSRASWQLTIMTTLGICVGTLLPYIPPVANVMKLHPMPLIYFPILAATILAYMALATLMKRIFVKKYGELL